MINSVRNHINTILIIDGHNSNTDIVEEFLKEEKFGLIIALGANDGLRIAHEQMPDLIILNIPAFDFDVYEYCKKIKKNSSVGHIPIILISEKSRKSEWIKGLEAGADDFITMPLEKIELIFKVKSLLRLKNLIEYKTQREKIESELNKKIELLKRKREEEREKRLFYRDCIYAFSDGKLFLMDKVEIDKEVAGGAVIQSLDILEPIDVKKARKITEEILAGLEVEDEKKSDIALGVMEAVTNVIKHAGSGIIKWIKYTDKLQICVNDKGCGIQFEELPKKALLKGYSTQKSLGLGFTILIELLDRILVSSGKEGTTIVLESVFKLC